MPALVSPDHLLKPGLGQAGYLCIVTSLVALVRFYIKRKRYGCDDVLYGLALLAYLAQAAATSIQGLPNGLGDFDSATDENERELSGEAYFVCLILPIIVLCLSKCSVVEVFLRIFDTGLAWDKNWTVCLMAVTTAWGLGSIIALAANWQCISGQVSLWQVITAIERILL